MKIFVIRFSDLKYLAAITVLVCLVFAVGLSNVDVAAVFGAKKLLPIYSVDRSDKVVSITFDCAWGAGDIPNILETLKKENVKATFFLVGQWAEKNPDAVKMMAADGHDVANHSYSHLKMGALDRSRISSEITKCNEVLKRLTGKSNDLFRPPYGDYNNTVIETANSLGLYTIQWDVDSLDWKPGISQEEIRNRVLRKVQPGSIILFHNDTPYTAKILPTIISDLKKEGYSFLPVSEMIMRDNYYMDVTGRQKRKN